MSCLVRNAQLLINIGNMKHNNIMCIIINIGIFRLYVIIYCIMNAILYAVLSTVSFRILWELAKTESS